MRRSILFSSLLLLTATLATAAAAQPLTPSLSALGPSMVTASSPAFTLVVTGSNIERGAVVRVNGSDRPTTYVNSPDLGLPLQLRAALTAADVTATGTLSITAINPGAGASESTPLSLTVTSFPIPLITSLSPVRVQADGSGLTLTLNGSNFPAFSAVFVGSTLHTPTWVSANQLTVTVANTEITTSGVLFVNVASLGPGSNAVPFVVFRYGDVNFDNTVDTSDIYALGDFLAGNVTLFDRTEADLNCDGIVNVTDLAILAKYLGGHITTLPVGTGCP